MNIAEIPSTAVLTAPGEWDDPTTYMKYFVDPRDATLVGSRSWTATEKDFVTQQRVARTDRRARLSSTAVSLVTDVKNDIGFAPTDPGLVAGTGSLNAILKMTNADLGPAAPAIKALARMLRRTDKLLLAVAKVDLQLLDDENLGN